MSTTQHSCKVKHLHWKSVKTTLEWDPNRSGVFGIEVTKVSQYK
jgi:hypothetical protein